jgi:hypothetical protein
MRAPEIVLVLWNGFLVNTTGAPARVAQFANDLVAGRFMNGLVQYGIDRGSVRTTVPIDPMANPPNKSTWDNGGSDDGDQLVAWLNNGTITTKPAVNEANLLYVIYLPGTLTLTNGKNDDGTPNTNVCGWHKNRKFNSNSASNDLFWCVIGTDGANTSSAQSFIDSVAFCASHEIAEAVTNRDGQGWHGDDGNNCEIGDLCESATDSGPIITFLYRRWHVEKYWSDWDNSCIQGDQPVSLRAFLNAIQFDSARPLSQLGTSVINLSFMASKLA